MFSKHLIIAFFRVPIVVYRLCCNFPCGEKNMKNETLKCNRDRTEIIPRTRSIAQASSNFVACAVT